MADFQSLLIVLAFIGLTVVIYRMLTNYLPGLFGLFYWAFWLLMIYLTDEGYNKPGPYALALIFSFIFAFTFFFAVGFGREKVGHAIGPPPSIFRIGPSPRFSRTHPFFEGRIYKFHLIITVSVTLLLMYWMLPYLNDFMAGRLVRNLLYTTDTEANPIFNTPLRSFVYFRIILGFHLYLYIYLLMAAFLRKSSVPILVLLLFVFFYSSTTLSRSSFANLFLLILVFALVLASKRSRSIFSGLKVLFNQNQSIYLGLSIVVAVVGMVGVSFNRIGGVSIESAADYTVNTIANYGVLGYASLSTDLNSSGTPLQDNLTFGSSFVEGLTKPIASVARRVGGPDLYYLLQPYGKTSFYRNSFNLVGVGLSRELTSNVHYSSVYAAYVDARFFGPPFFGALWGFLTGFSLGKWRSRSCIFSFAIGVLLIYLFCSACHVHPAERESFWFPIIIFLAAKKWYIK